MRKSTLYRLLALLSVVLGILMANAGYEQFTDASGTSWQFYALVAGPLLIAIALLITARRIDTNNGSGSDA